LVAMADVAVWRVDFGYFIRPAEETGTGAPRVEPCLGYVIDHPDGVLLFDTGMGSDADVDAHYRPARRPLAAALAATGYRLDQVTVVANCHLHFDHCGGNLQLAGRPVLVQGVELETARHTAEYTLPDLVDSPALCYEQLSGEAEIMAGVLVLPTPGHTAGHQSLVVRRADGVVIVVAGQSHDTSSAYGADVLARRAALDERPPPLPLFPVWMDRLQRLDPSTVVFAHDNAVWQP
jgi:N-acyl homoserine lactone hydrolase